MGYAYEGYEVDEECKEPTGSYKTYHAPERPRSRIVGLAVFLCAAVAIGEIGRSKQSRQVAGPTELPSLKDKPAPKRLHTVPQSSASSFKSESTAWEGAMTANGSCVEMKIADYGIVVLQLTDDATPVTVANFLEYVDEGFYNSTIFHRVISNFMIQGGTVNTKFREKTANDAIVDEAKYGLQNLDTTIAMARYSAADSATDSFYINVVDNVYLDYSASKPVSDGYCAFGRVVQGMEHVYAVSDVATHTYDGWDDVPKTEVVISSMTRTECPASLPHLQDDTPDLGDGDAR